MMLFDSKAAPAAALCSLLLNSVSAGVAQEADASFNGFQYVDQLIGTSNGGNVFGGASLPYGMAKAVADTDSGSDQGGFTTDNSKVIGFSHLHDSGTGGSPSLGNFPLFPYSSCPGGTPDGCTYPRSQRPVNYDNSSVVAHPGYFKIGLENGIDVDMTTTQHTTLMRFQFPTSDEGLPLILLDLADLSQSRQDNATITVNANTGRMSGGGRFEPSFGEGTYKVYFCTDFKGPSMHDNGIFVDDRASADVKHLKISRGINEYPLPGGGFVRFANPGGAPVMARTGVSFISPEQACSNAENEIPTFDFESVHAAARKEWKSKINRISVVPGGADDSYLKNFYSGIYRTMVNPQNYTGENPLWQSTEPYFDSFYCLWDSFRSQIPFLTVLDGEAVTEMIRGLLNIYEHEGYLPDCRMSLSKGFTQGGSNADNILADGYVKGLKKGISWETALEAVIKDASTEPYDWCCEGRGGLQSWNRLGYIPVQDFDYIGFGTHTRSVSRTLEYSYNDFCLTQIASGLGKQGLVEQYRKSSENWKNLYDPKQKGDNTGFTGFFQPRYLNQTFGYQNPLSCSNIDNSQDDCSLTSNGRETFESSIFEYQFFVPHDQASLISTYGGPKQYVDRLQYLHLQNITYIGNEPAFLTVFQYHYAGRPGLSAVRSHYYIPSFFKPTTSGLPGNDDSGAMGSFLAFSMMGLFPNPGQNVYLITPPYFKSISITNPLTGKTSTIRNENFDPSYKNIFIQSATLNGKPYEKNWIDHSFFTEGKELVLHLGAKESKWGTRAADLPPSLGTGPAGM